MSNFMESTSSDVIIDTPRSASIKIKENLLKLSSLFSSHTVTLMSMCDDILFSSSDYFDIQYLGSAPINENEVNSFTLTTTSIYSGIFLQQKPLNLKTKNKKNYYESCTISFNNQQKIIRVEFKIIITKSLQKELINLILNSRFEIINFTWKIMDFNKNTFENNINYKDLFIPDFIQLLKLKCNANEQIIEILPELVIPSAYNMRSDEFKDRLSLVDMILI